jgi:hypothetical protein
MKYRYSILSIFIILLLLPGLVCAENNTFEGYIKKDIFLEEYNYKLYKGEEIWCEINEKTGECCFGSHSGTMCVDSDVLSKDKIPTVDLYFENVRFSDDDLAVKDACTDGRSIEILPDSFKWSYGFEIKSSEPIEEPVLVEATHIIVKEDMPVYSLAFSKRWEGKIDGKCHVIKFTKEDIDTFLKEYHVIADDLDVQLDLNISVKFVLQIFSKRIEDNYENNMITIYTWLPGDNSTSWPPKTMPPGWKEEYMKHLESQ